MPRSLCDDEVVIPARHCGRTLITWLMLSALALLLAGATSLSAASEVTNNSAVTNAPASVGPVPQATQSEPPRVEAASQKLDESAFQIISERNIFNANRSGGQVRLATRRQARVEFFTLVGTMAYEKGAFAFFEGSSSEYTKAIKASGVIAGHKIVDVLDTGVKLEADGKIQELPIGSAMRREDEGLWHLGEASGGGTSSYAASRENGESSRSNRSSRGERNENSRSRRGESDSERGRNSETVSRPAPTTSSPVSAAEQSEILKRLMERREKE